MRKPLVAALLAVAGLVLASQPTSAQDGLAFLHPHVRIGNRICMADHFHSGNGSGASKRQAMEAAIRDWSGFTSWEYGAHWGIWRLSETKRASCGQSSAGWTCQVEARPCRPVGP